MEWEKLIDIGQETLERGAVFRTPAVWPYEEYVDFMVMEDPASESGFSLWVVSGYKSGLRLVCLPVESKAKVESGLEVAWLLENWKIWIYPESSPDEVLVRIHGLSAFSGR